MSLDGGSGNDVLSATVDTPGEFGGTRIEALGGGGNDTIETTVSVHGMEVLLF